MVFGHLLLVVVLIFFIIIPAFGKVVKELSAAIDKGYDSNDGDYGKSFFVGFITLIIVGLMYLSYHSIGLYYIEFSTN